ncbi:HAD family hydrolase [Undibacterium flavidum]|uniref:HAD family phosphatase n=1 Tax=Undibacterium flavidum TaxID=2762297 RepID=A0ABR6Y8G4_9BURK|nr:HAD family phosphatase [Undibacterium flavidum]MBC3872900.1 HAD family phosphatase [Undibacterium flavidum]
MKHGILWDNDGVLVDTEGLFYQANRSLFAEHDIDLTPELFFDWFLLENLGAWHLLEARGMNADEIGLLRDERNRRYSALLQSTSDLEITGVKPLLTSLQTKVKMGIVTSSRPDHFHLIHSKLDLLPHFEFVVTDADYVNSKPAPDPYLLGLEKLAIAKEHCMVIEDSPRGLRSAISAGLNCVVIRNHLSRHFAFEGAYRVVDNYVALGAVIEEFLCTT